MTILNRRLFLEGAAAIGVVTLIAGPAISQTRVVTPAGYAGSVHLLERNGVRIHTYLADPKGAMVTSHIIETANGLVVVDGQFMPAPARELKAYMDSLGKPVLRVILSHMHPDHWFGLKHAGLGEVHAGPVTAKFLETSAQALIEQRKADAAAPKVAGVIAAGVERIGGVEFRFAHVLDTEAPEIVTVEIPAAGALIVQDIVYNRVHAVVSRQLGNWISVLRGMETGARATPVILAGHGEPAAPSDLPKMIAYLEAVRPLLEANIGNKEAAAKIVAEMTRAFPDYRVPPLLNLGLSRAL